MANRVKKSADADESGKETPPEDSTLTLLRDQFEEFVQGTVSSRALAEKCRDYRDGKQLTEDELKVLKSRRQPAVIDNKIQDKCDTLLGIEKQMRTDPRAYPRNPNPEDEGAAEAATDALRFVADQNNYQRTVRRAAADNLIVEGTAGGHVIVTKDGKGKAKVCIEHIRWDRLYWDIHSLKDDFSDKEYCGMFTWMDLGRAKREFDPATNKLADKEALDNLEMSFSQESLTGPDDSHDDKPRYIMTSRGRKRIQVFETYYREDGQWWYAKWCRGGFLETPRKSAYLDEDGQPTCCIEIQALYRDADGNPYGAVPRYLDLQDEHNKRRSKLLHLLNSKQLIAEKGAFENIADARKQLHQPDGVLEPNQGFKWEIEKNLDLGEGQWRLLEQTSAALAATGPNSALQGQSGDISGRAKQLDQVSGALPLTPLFEALDGWELRIYRQAWMRIRQFWTAETWVRVTDDENKVKFVALNQPMTHGDVIAQQLKNEQLSPEDKQAFVQQMAQDPQAQAPLMGEDGKPRLKNHVAKMDVDIIIDRSPDVVNLQQEQFETLAKLAETRPEVPFAALIKASALRADTKKSILDGMSGQGDPAQAQAMQAQAAQMQEAQVAIEEKGKELQAAQEKIAAEAAAVEKAKTDVMVKTADSKVKEADLKTQMAELDRQQAELAQQRAELKAEIAQFRQMVAEDDKQLAERSVEQANGATQEQSSVVDQFRDEHRQAMQEIQQALNDQRAARDKPRQFNAKRAPDGSMTVTVQ